MFTTSRYHRNIAYLAWERALTSKVKTGRHCAIILDGNNNIVSSFVNHLYTHAEHGAIEKIDSDTDMSEYVMIVVRANLLGVFTNSKPCPNCHASIKKSGIKTCIYSTGDDNKFNVI